MAYLIRSRQNAVNEEEEEEGQRESEEECKKFHDLLSFLLPHELFLIRDNATTSNTTFYYITSHAEAENVR